MHCCAGRRRLHVSLEAPLKVRVPDVTPTQTLRYVALEQTTVRLQDLGRILVQRVIGIGLQEQVLQAVHDRVDGQHGLPVLPQDVQADVALQIDVRVIDLGLALDLGRFMGIAGAHLEVEPETTAFVEALVRTDDELEVEQVIGVRELGRAGLGQVQFVEIWKGGGLVGVLCGYLVLRPYPSLSGAGQRCRPFSATQFWDLPPRPSSVASARTA